MCQWSDLTSNKICNEIKNFRKKMERQQLESGIIIAAGEKAYSIIRQFFPEDTENLKVVNCCYCESDQCFVVRNMRFL